MYNDDGFFRLKLVSRNAGIRKNLQKTKQNMSEYIKQADTYIIIHSF